jgi:four helix bundle protein
LAEGCGRSSDADFARFCAIALGSASELDSLLLLAYDLPLLRDQHYRQLAAHTTEVKRMLFGLIHTLTADC